MQCVLQKIISYLFEIVGYRNVIYLKVTWVRFTYAGSDEYKMLANIHDIFTDDVDR